MYPGPLYMTSSQFQFLRPLKIISLKN